VNKIASGIKAGDFVQQHLHSELSTAEAYPANELSQNKTTGLKPDK
jgi:hypothetical protein